MAIRAGSTPWCSMAQSMRRDMSHTRSPIGVRPSSRSCMSCSRQEDTASLFLSAGERVSPKARVVGAITR